MGADQKLIYTNRDSLEYCGLRLEDIQGSGTRARLVHPDDLTRVSEETQRGFSTAAPFATEARFRRHDGQYRWFLIRLNPVHDPEGRVGMKPAFPVTEVAAFRNRFAVSLLQLDMAA